MSLGERLGVLSADFHSDLNHPPKDEEPMSREIVALLTSLWIIISYESFN
jgi:hypothetical protein